MSFQIVKGWPAEGALDVTLTKETGEDMSLGQVVNVNASGRLEVSTAQSDDTSIMGFTIGNELAMQSINPDYAPEANDFIVLLNECVIECDDNHHEGVAAGDLVTSNAGKFATMATADSTPAIGKVLSKDGTTGVARILFFGNK